MNTYVTHLESALDGTCLPAGQVHTMHQGRPLWVCYDLARLRDTFPRAFLARRVPYLVPDQHRAAAVPR